MEHLILVTVLRFASVAVLDVVSVAVAVLDVGWFCWPWRGVVGGHLGGIKYQSGNLYYLPSLLNCHCACSLPPSFIPRGFNHFFKLIQVDLSLPPGAKKLSTKPIV